MQYIIFSGCLFLDTFKNDNCWDCLGEYCFAQHVCFVGSMAEKNTGPRWRETSA